VSRGHGIDTTGWIRLARLNLQTSRKRLLAWPLVTAFLIWVTAGSLPAVYSTPQAREAYQAAAGGSTATRVINGRGYGLDTIGGITAYELGFYTLLVFPVVAMHLAIHLTRSQESSGRFDLLTASRLGRTAPLVSAIVVLTGVLGLTALLSYAGLLAADLGEGAAWYAAGLLVQLLAMAALGILVAQIASDGQGAHGLGLLVLGVLFLVRAIVDGVNGSATWLSPLGWFAEIRPFGEPRLWPIVAYAGLTLVLVSVAALVNVRRDLGSGLISPRPGSAVAPAGYGTPVGLSVRLLRGMWLSWTLGSLVWAVLIGALAREMRQLIEDNPQMAQVLDAQGVDPEDLMVSVGAFFIALLALGFAVHALMRLAAEETNGRLGVVLSQPLSRARWWLGSSGTVLAAATAMLLVCGLGLGVGLWVGTGEVVSVWTGLWLGAAFVTAVLLGAAVTLLLAAISPRLAGAGWAVFALVMTIDFLGPALDLPGWVLDLSPFQHVGRPPIEDVQLGGVLVMGALAAALVAASAWWFRRRDLTH
jgi:ABC-2 type transport system permease protein